MLRSSSSSSSHWMLPTGRRGMAVSVGKPGGRLVILGTGWGGFSLLKKIDAARYDVVVVSPRNHFVFTPLLAGSAVGTLEHRCTIEPIRGQKTDMKFYQAFCDSVDFSSKTLSCSMNLEHMRDTFSLTYDQLVIACGAIPSTFGIPGVEKYANFLKEVQDARKIRQQIIECYEHCSQPDISEEEIDRTLSFVIVGGGPTGVEFSGELLDFVRDDLAKLYPRLQHRVRITIFEAGQLLNSFDKSLSQYAQRNLSLRGVAIRTGTAVKEVKAREVILANGEVVPFGLLVWSTGIGARSFIKNLKTAKYRSGQLLTDDHLRVLREDGKTPFGDVYAIGDCASMQGNALAATAQVAKQEGYFLAKYINARITSAESSLGPFSYHHMGSFAYIGGWNALVEEPIIEKSKAKISGRLAWLVWRSAYFSMTVSMKNKILIPMYWFLTWIFGRDVSRF